MAYKLNNSGYYVGSDGKKYDAASGWEQTGSGTLRNSYTGATVSDVGSSGSSSASSSGSSSGKTNVDYTQRGSTSVTSGSSGSKSTGSSSTQATGRILNNGTSGTSTGSSRNTSATVSNANAALANAGTIRSSPTVYDQQSALAAMKQNSQDWTGASAANQNALARENVSLANTYFPGATRDDKGVWYYNGSPLYDMDFSGGGTAGGSSPKGLFNPAGGGETDPAITWGVNGEPGEYAESGFYRNPFGDSGSDVMLESQMVPNVTDNLMTYGIIQQMRQNSEAWLTADEATRKKLAAKNQELAKQIPGAYIGNDGVWYLGGQRLYDMQYQAPQVELPAFEYTPFEQTEMGLQMAQTYQDLLDKVQNRDAFTYDPYTDPAYLQYADSYTRGGQRAMTDVLGQLAARTGGLASSYAGSMAQQTYDQYMTDLANKIPELRQLAYSMYVDDYNRDVDAYNRAYNQYTDAYGRWYDKTRFDYDMYQDDLEQAWKNAEWKNTIDQQNRNNYYDVLDREEDLKQQERDNKYREDNLAYMKDQAELDRQQAQEERRDQEMDRLIGMVERGYRPTQEDAVRLGLSPEYLAQLQRWADVNNEQENSSHYYYRGY